MEWIDASKKLPEEEGEILFIAKTGLTNERIGIALPHLKHVILKRTDLKFNDLLWWMPIPNPPKLEN